MHQISAQLKLKQQQHLPDITRVTTIKLLVVTFANSLSVAEHVPGGGSPAQLTGKLAESIHPTE